MKRSGTIWWIVAAAALGTTGYLYFSSRQESYGMQALPGGRVTSELFPSRRPANAPRPAPVAPGRRGDSNTAPPTGLRIVNPEPSPAAERRP